MADRTELVGEHGAAHGTRREVLRAIAVLLALPILACLAGPAPEAAAQEAISGAPDLSDVTTKAAARRLVRQGQLVEISLFPTELGGPRDPQNVGYITPEAADARAQVIGTLRRYVEDGLIDQLDVVPDYKGESIVPSRITMTATHSAKGGSIALAIEVW